MGVDHLITGKRELSTIQYSEAGIVSGLLTRALIQPLDVLKIRFQLQEEPLRGELHGKYHGFIQSIKLIYKEEGMTAFWKGHLPAQGLSTAFSLVMFTSYEFLSKEFSTIKSLNDKKEIRDFLCGSIAGCSGTVFSTPLDVIRTRLVAQGEPKVYNGALHAIRRIWKFEGISGFYRGFAPSILQIAPYTGLQFLIYNFLTRRWNEHIGHNPIGLMVCGASAGIFAKTTLYPLDLIRHRLQVNPFARRGFGRTSRPTGMFHSFLIVVSREGSSGLFKGLLPSLMKAGLTSGFSFMFYKLACDLLQSD